jgi:hypothetical protein
MPDSAATIDESLPALFTRRMAFSLAAGTLFLGALSAWALAVPGSWLPLTGVISASALPLWVVETSLLVTIFIAPLIFEIEPDSRQTRWLLGRALFAAVWQGITLSFFLMVASRVTPVESSRILLASTYLAFVALALFLLAAAMRKFFSALSFAWCVALPVGTYFLVELFLFSPGGSKGWAQSTGAAADALRTATHWILSLSPPTGLMGALNGILPGGSDFSATIPLIVLGTVSICLTFLISRASKI